MTNPRQIKAARALLGITQVQLAKLAGISPQRIYVIEAGGDCLQSTANAIRIALERKGAVFSRDGGVRVAEKSERFLIEPGQTPDEATVRAAAAIIAAANKARTPRGGLG
jgi:DNA-binding XRE family transcriptional regulator